MPAMLLRAFLAGAIVLVAIAPRARAQDREAAHEVRPGITVPGLRIAWRTADREPGVFCGIGAECPVRLDDGTELVLGWAREGREIEWIRTVRVESDLRLDVRIEDHAPHRSIAYALIVAGGLLVATTAFIGIATEPTPPDHGWFGENHGLVFAGIAGGILLAFGIPGVAIALAFERDTPAIDPVLIDEDEGAGEE